MKKNIIFITLILGLFVGLWVYALTVTQIVDNTIVYLKKLVFTDDGTNNGNQNIVIDGTNGSITMSGALNIQPDALADNTVTTNDLVNSAVTTEKIADGAITQDKIDPNVSLGVFKKNGTYAYYNGGNVWIWTSNPSERLEVNGNIKATKIFAKYLCDENGLNCKLLKVVNGQCWSANGSTVSSQPTNNLCAAWTVSWIDTTATDGAYNWICQGQNGWTDASCSANRSFTYTWEIWDWWTCSATCGWWTQTRSVVCKRDDGTPVDDSFCPSPKPATSQSCNTQACPTPVNGQCGTSNGWSFFSQPITNLCAAWIVSWTDTTATDGTYNWICQGQDGWTDASCSATKQTCGSPITITVNGITYTYNTKLMPDGKCWTSQNMRHPPKNLDIVPLNSDGYEIWWWYYNDDVSNSDKWLLYTRWAAAGCTNPFCKVENFNNSVCGQLWEGWHLPSRAEWLDLIRSLWCYWSVWWGWCSWLGWDGYEKKRLNNLIQVLPWRRRYWWGKYQFVGINENGYRRAAIEENYYQEPDAPIFSLFLNDTKVYEFSSNKINAYSVICTK